MFRQMLTRIEPTLARAYRRFLEPPPPNLRGDRDIEYSWIAVNCPEGPGTGLEFGCRWSYMALVAVRKGFKMFALDIAPVRWFYAHPHLSFVQKDIFDFDLQEESLDLIINCSAIEHVGLGKYGDRLGHTGDLDAMKKLRSLLKPGGIMVLTIPVGKDAVFPPLHRVYGKERLPRLLEGFSVEKCEYWLKGQQNKWIQASEDSALGWQATPTCYALGCFVLKNIDKTTVRSGKQ